MTAWWQHLPGQIDPIAFTVGFFSVHWYAVFWILGFVSVWYMTRRLRVGSTEEILWEELLPLLFIGVLLGGHVGYGLFYQPEYFFSHPFRFFLPYSNETGLWTGIRGMSFYGGLMGVGIVLWFQARKLQKNFFVLADRVALLTPVALFFGRLGNFLNQELPGRLTTMPWGMYFPDELPFGVLRHPSTLYEAILEGIVLFCFLRILSRKVHVPGQLTASFLIGYGLLRFMVEFFREPDPGSDFFFGGLTLGQVFSLGTVLLGSVLLFWLERKRHATI